MTRRQQRLMWLCVGALLLVLATIFVLKAFRTNLVFFYTPTQIANHEVPRDEAFRIGGLVTAGSLKRGADGLSVQFDVTDLSQTVRVSYHGLLPDLFKEGKGVVALGTMRADGTFVASEVLAKHDENYMPPEAAAALKQAGHPVDGKIPDGDRPATVYAPGASAPHSY